MIVPERLGHIPCIISLVPYSLLDHWFCPGASQHRIGAAIHPWALVGQESHMAPRSPENHLGDQKKYVNGYIWLALRLGGGGVTPNYSGLTMALLRDHFWQGWGGSSVLLTHYTTSPALPYILRQEILQSNVFKVLVYI